MKPINTQTILITGSTDGIGRLTALEIAKQNARVLVHGRDERKLDNVVEELKQVSGNQNIDGFLADLSSLAEVRRLSERVLEKYDALDVLINNAGVGFSDERHSRDGYELRFAVNYLTPVLLTRRLLPVLKAAAPSRIVNVASAGQHPIDFADVMLERGFEGTRAYSQSKLALIMFTIDLAHQLKDTRVTVNSLHPGTYLNTNMVRNAGITPLGDPQSGAEAVCRLAVSPALEEVNGKYFNVMQEARALPQAYDARARQKLHELTLELIGKH